jgi:hypothetical protein
MKDNQENPQSENHEEMREIKSDGPTKANLPLEKKTVEEINAILPGIANTIDSMIPGGYGFVLLIAPICNNGIMSYIATINREDAMRLMGEMIHQSEAHHKLTPYQQLLRKHFMQTYQCDVEKGTDHNWLLSIGKAPPLQFEEFQLVSGISDKHTQDHILSRLIDAFAPPHIMESAKQNPDYIPDAKVGNN